jgi:hypothetical protein
MSALEVGYVPSPGIAHARAFEIGSGQIAQSIGAKSVCVTLAELGDETRLGCKGSAQD